MTAQSDPGAASDGANARGMFVLFSLLLAIGTLFNQGLATEWQLFSLDTVLAMACLWTALRPSSLIRFSLMVSCHLLDLLIDLPFVMNHVFLEGIVDLSALLCMAIVALGSRRSEFDTARLYRLLAPQIRLIAVLMYFFAGLAKINRDFFIPELSSAVFLLNEVREMLPIVPGGAWTALPTIWATVIFEMALPLALLVRGLRVPAVLVAGVFHVAMGLSGHMSFSALAPALLLPFLPDDLPTRLQRLRCEWPRVDQGLQREYAFVQTRGAFPKLAGVWLFLAAAHSSGLASEWTMSLVLFSPVGAKMLVYPYLLGLIALVALCARQGGPFAHPRHALRLAHPATALIPALMLLNGLSPYLGLKTETSFSMFSNLQTEGDQWNHLLLPASLRIFPYQDDLVTIVDSTHPLLANQARKGKRWIFFEFQRFLSQHPDVGVSFEHRGDSFQLARVGDHPEFSSPQPLLARKALWFRHVARPRVNGHRH